MQDEKSVLADRFVCCGFAEENLEDIRKDSPTCSQENFLFASLFAQEWLIKVVDSCQIFF